MVDKEKILAQIQEQRENQISSPLKDPKYRVQLLKKLRCNIQQMEGEILQALQQDLGKSRVEGYMCEVGMVLSELNYMIKHLRKFAKPKKVSSPIAQFPAKSYQVPTPYGVVLIISPWNYPFMLTLDPIIDAISAGNSIVVKPSETSKNTSAVIAKLLEKTFSPKEVCVCLGGREDCEFLLEQPFDHIFFTGSSRVGKIVLESASKHFTPVTLELGGKSPCIVDQTANIPLSAKRIVFGKFLNAGQTCVAPDFIYCHESVKNKLVEELKKQIVLQYSEKPLENENYPKLINEKQFNFACSLVEGEKVLLGGNVDNSSFKIEPTLVDATFESKTMQNEIFAPILPIVTFDDIDNAILNLRKMEKPLAFYVFSNKKENQHKFLSSCDFGGGCINDVVIHLASTKLPFGGVGHSGMGAYHGKKGFETFSHTRSIVDKKTWLDLPIRYQPHTKKKEKLIRKFMR